MHTGPTFVFCASHVIAWKWLVYTKLAKPNFSMWPSSIGCRRPSWQWDFRHIFFFPNVSLLSVCHKLSLPVAFFSRALSVSKSVPPKKGGAKTQSRNHLYVGPTLHLFSVFYCCSLAQASTLGLFLQSAATSLLCTTTMRRLWSSAAESRCTARYYHVMPDLG